MTYSSAESEILRASNELIEWVMVEDGKYSQLFANMKTGYEDYNFLFFLLYFLEQWKINLNCQNHLQSFTVDIIYIYHRYIAAILKYGR